MEIIEKKEKHVKYSIIDQTDELKNKVKYNHEPKSNFTDFTFN